MPQTIDVSGLPTPVIQDIQNLVRTLRENLTEPTRSSQQTICSGRGE